MASEFLLGRHSGAGRNPVYLSKMPFGFVRFAGCLFLLDSGLRRMTY